MGQRGGHESGIAHGRQIDEADTLGKVATNPGTHLDGKAGLSNAGRTGQVDQTDVISQQHLLDGGTLTLAAKKTSGLRLQVAQTIGRATADPLHG
jgi:hypothetical protein